MPECCVMRPLLRPPDMNPEGIVEGDWVRLIRGTRVGFVERVIDNTATVNWLDGHFKVIGCLYLRRAEPRDKDRRVCDG